MTIGSPPLRPILSSKPSYSFCFHPAEPFTCITHSQHIHPLLALLIPITPLTNHLPIILQVMLTMLLINYDSFPYDSYALCHRICSFSFDLLIPCFPPLSFGPHAMISPYSWLCTPFYLCFCSFPWLSSLFRLSPSITQPDYTAYQSLTNFLQIAYQALSHLCLQGHSSSCINTSSQRLQGSVCFPLNKATTFTLPHCL